MYRFFKFGNKWSYKHQSWETAKPIDTFALERILGVIGGPEVIVVREQPNNERVHVTIINGFIDKAEIISISTECVYSEEEGERCWVQHNTEEVDKFYARELDS